MNGRLLSSGLVDELFVQPAAHDAGCALGAALAGVWTGRPDDAGGAALTTSTGVVDSPTTPANWRRAGSRGVRLTAQERQDSLRRPPRGCSPTAR